MSATASFPFERLPVELQREIFVVAATSDPRDALQLVFVAKRVHEWVQPIVYEMVTLGANDALLFLRTMASVPPKFLEHRVKKMCLTVSVRAQNARRILSTCTGVVDLAFWVDYIGIFPDDPISLFISPLRLQRLSIEIKHFKTLFTDLETRQTWWDTLTHLDLVFWTHDDEPAAPELCQLSSLTHLSLRLRHSHPTTQSLTAILLACRCLKVLIILDDPDSSDTEDTISPMDPRIVWMPYPVNIVQDWEAQAKNEPHCIWSRAEDLVRSNIAQRERSKSVSTTGC
ncbi:hypothetical protein D9613_011534 [Agrocybe pediades]|uniref:Uncharacterized protein n=1 Tax=Agrocybe pediades TaxID=84607 RepID=A0A8H4QVY5_9AGAR|nr:hypothetical protein D9613_011534 [Agrocybe pediades]